MDKPTVTTTDVAEVVSMYINILFARLTASGNSQSTA
jgi:hypothetical protein